MVRYLVDEDHSSKDLVIVEQKEITITKDFELSFKLRPYAVSLVKLEKI